MDFAVERGESRQVDLVMLQDARERIRRAASKIVEIELRDQRGDDLVFAVPAEARRIQDVALEFHQAHRAQAKLPKRARGMKQIEMRRELRNFDGARHGEAALEQWPVTGLAVKGDQDGTLRDASCQFVQQRIFLAKIAKEQLLDLKAAGIPPGQPYEERVGARAAGEASGFRVEEQPTFRIFQGRSCAAR